MQLGLKFAIGIFSENREENIPRPVIRDFRGNGGNRDFLSGDGFRKCLIFLWADDLELDDSPRRTADLLHRLRSRKSRKTRLVGAYDDISRPQIICLCGRAGDDPLYPDSELVSGDDRPDSLEISREHIMKYFGLLDIKILAIAIIETLDKSSDHSLLELPRIKVLIVDIVLLYDIVYLGKEIEINF